MVMPFDPDSLDNPQRRKALPIKEILRYVVSLPLERGVAVDVGAGTGYLTIPLSWTFRKVYAIEADNKMSELLRRNLGMRGVENVEVLLTDERPKAEPCVLLALAP